MKNSNLYILLAFATLLAACSSNQDLASLDEYDDLYYQGGSALSASLSSAPTSAGQLDGASDAERSYYDNVPYIPQEEVADEEVTSDSDYYDENYANRIENFNGSNNNGEYLYTDNSPSVSYNFGFGVGSYGSGFNMGMSYGSPGYGGFGGYPSYGLSYMYSPYYSPWYRPYYPMYSWYRPYYDPFYPYGGYGGYYGGGYYGGYGGGYYGGGYYGGGYGGGYPPYYGGDYSGSNGITSTPRQGSSSVRPSRGGVISSDRGSNGSETGRSEIATPSVSRAGVSGTDRQVEARKAAPNREQDDNLSESRRSLNSERSQDVDLRSKSVQRSETNREYYNSRDAREYTRPGTSRADDVSNQQPTRARSSATPSRSYTPQTRQRDAIAPATRSRSTAQPSSPSYNNQRSSGSSTTPTRSKPSRNYNSGNSRSSSPSVSPSPSRSTSPSNSGGSNSRSSSPSRGSRR